MLYVIEIKEADQLLENIRGKLIDKKIESSMRDYDKQHPERNQKDNYTIAIRNAQRKEQERAMKTQFASMALLPVFGIGAIPAVANLYVANKRNNTLSEIIDEHNIEVAKRVINM